VDQQPAFRQAADLHMPLLLGREGCKEPQEKQVGQKQGGKSPSIPGKQTESCEEQQGNGDGDTKGEAEAAVQVPRQAAEDKKGAARRREDENPPEEASPPRLGAQRRKHRKGGNRSEGDQRQKGLVEHTSL